MQHIHRERAAPPRNLPPDDRRVFVSRGVDLRYRAQRWNDGEVVAEADERGEVKSLAERLGYAIN